MASQQHELRTIFCEAMERQTPQQRAKYLDEACTGRPEVRARVEALLEAHEQASSFLREGADQNATLDAPANEHAGGTVGPYKLLEQIGAGGFGVVYMAEQIHPIRRKVALKVVKPGMDTREVIARFEAERQALAIMDHPNIAKVLDGGATESGRPFFVMELVRGVPMTDFCDQNRLAPRERLELFMHVCHAVQHAHQKGIIHRDLKPSNVLVSVSDGKPLVKVIDFGIAKALGQQLTDKTVYTGFAQLIGTPLYMSPEQAGQSFDIDTRTDIYSLGVMLYELLTGTTPFTRERFKTAAFDEIRRIIREEDPPKPSTRLSASKASLPSLSAQRQTEAGKLTRLLRGELDWIVMKALEKDRNRRYDTAGAFAADVQRFLADEAVQACPPSAGYRLRKFFRRHKGPVVAASVFVILLAAGIVGTTGGLFRALAAERNTRDALTQVTTEQAKTQAALKAAREALDALTDQVVETMFAKQSVLDESQKEFLRKVLAMYEGFTQQLADTAEAHFLRAKGQYQVAHLQSLLGDQTQAAAGFRQALTLLEQLAQDHPEVPEYRYRLAATANRLGILLAEQGRRGDAESAFRRSVSLWKKLADENPQAVQYRRALATGDNDLAYLLHLEKKYADAEATYRQALDLEGKLLAAKNPTPADQTAQAHTQIGLASLLREQKKFTECEDLFRRALETLQKLTADLPGNPKLRSELASCFHGLAIALIESERVSEGEAAFRQALAIRKKLVEDFPKINMYRLELANDNTDLGRALVRQGKTSEAEGAFREALTLREKVDAEAGPVARYRQQLAGNYDDLGVLLRNTNRPDEAKAMWLKALALWKQLAADSPTNPDYQHQLGGTLGKLATLHNKRTEFAAALRLLEEARPHHQTALDADPANPLYRRFFHDHLREMSEAHWGLTNHARLAKTAEELAGCGCQPPTDAYDAAWLLCRCAMLAEADPELVETQRKELARNYADRGMAQLQQAVALGYKDVTRLQLNPDLDLLRERQEFKKLLDALEPK